MRKPLGEVGLVLYFLCLVVGTGGEGGIWYTMVLMSQDSIKPRSPGEMLYFRYLVVGTGGEGGIWYTMVLMSSSRHQATLPRSVAFDCSNPSFLFRQRKMTPPERVRSFFLAEKEGFEPSIPFWGIHDFQSCALGQLRDFSMCVARFLLSQDSLCIIL